MDLPGSWVGQVPSWSNRTSETYGTRHPLTVTESSYTGLRGCRRETKGEIRQ